MVLGCGWRWYWVVDGDGIGLWMKMILGCGWRWYWVVDGDGIGLWIVIYMYWVVASGWRMVLVCGSPDYPFQSLFIVDNPLDYMGRSFLHIPQDVDVNLKADEPPERCYVPKKLIYTWYEQIYMYMYYVYCRTSGDQHHECVYVVTMYMYCVYCRTLGD